MLYKVVCKWSKVETSIVKGTESSRLGWLASHVHTERFCALCPRAIRQSVRCLAPVSAAPDGSRRHCFLLSTRQVLKRASSVRAVHATRNPVHPASKRRRASAGSRVRIQLLGGQHGPSRTPREAARYIPQSCPQMLINPRVLYYALWWHDPGQYRPKGSLALAERSRERVRTKPVSMSRADWATAPARPQEFPAPSHRSWPGRRGPRCQTLPSRQLPVPRRQQC